MAAPDAIPPTLRAKITESWRQQMYPALDRDVFYKFLADETATGWDETRREIAALNAIVLDFLSLPSSAAPAPSPEQRELDLIRAAARDEKLSDAAVRRIAHGLEPVTPDDIAWASRELAAPSRAPEPAKELFSERKMFTPKDMDAQTKPLHAEIERLRAALADHAIQCPQCQSAALVAAQKEKP